MLPLALGKILPYAVYMDALEFVRERLGDKGVNLREVADGAGVGHSWLRMFRRGEIPDPAYSRIKRLADYFLRVGSPLSTDVHPPQSTADGQTPRRLMKTQQAAWSGAERRGQHGGSHNGRKRQMA